MMFLLFFFIFLIVHGQLSIDELFSSNSKYTSTGNCTDFQYTFSNFQINENNYNQLSFNCQSSSISFRNTKQISSSFCPEDENDSENVRIHFHQLSQTFIQVNQLHFHGIELCSLDDLIQNNYLEYSYYRSQWALLINLENQNYLAITTNGEMTFIIFILASKYNTALKDNQVEIIFPNENIFKFNRSSVNVWRIDQGYVRSAKSLETSITYQLSKSKFTLFNNETFFLYGTQVSNPYRFIVSIDQTLVTCSYDYILQCIFPILPWNIHDDHEPILRVIYNRKSIFNANLTLISRPRLNGIPTNHSLTDIGTYKIHTDGNLCPDNSLKSLFTFIIHLWTENINGTVRYQNTVKNDTSPIDCNTTANIGWEIENITKSTPIDDIVSLNVDLIHQWYGHPNCRAERTRITFY